MMLHLPLLHCQERWFIAFVTLLLVSSIIIAAESSAPSGLWSSRAAANTTGIVRQEQSVNQAKAIRSRRQQRYSPSSFNGLWMRNTQEVQGESPKRFFTLSITSRSIHDRLWWSVVDLGGKNHSNHTTTVARGDYGRPDWLRKDEIIPLDDYLSLDCVSKFRFKFRVVPGAVDRVILSFVNGGTGYHDFRIFSKVDQGSFSETIHMGFDQDSEAYDLVRPLERLDCDGASPDSTIPNNMDDNQALAPYSSAKKRHDGKIIGSAVGGSIGFVVILMSVLICSATKGEDENSPRTEQRAPRPDNNATATPEPTPVDHGTDEPGGRKEFVKNNLLSMSVRSFFGSAIEFVQSLSSRSERIHDTSSKSGRSVALCAICLAEYKDGEQVCFATNTNCQHTFHRECMEGWLEGHDECPCCRQAYLQTNEEMGP